ncbi:MAG: hypothetical protein LBE39_03270 [Flavobacteriaceae bacterium]|jgi:hypothetical protein|nr:hypothetical protein [Flavobacteriaceae bacterium]
MENNDESKRKYISPKLDVEIIEMEYGIAAGSTVQPGGGNGIEVDPWEDGGSAGNGEPGNEWWN